MSYVYKTDYKVNYNYLMDTVTKSSKLLFSEILYTELRLFAHRSVSLRRTNFKTSSFVYFDVLNISTQFHDRS